jgi:hypothetical protein
MKSMQNAKCKSQSTTDSNRGRFKVKRVPLYTFITAKIPLNKE